MAWTDERMDDLAGRMDAGFARVDGDIRHLRTEVGVLRTEMRTEFRDVRGEIAELRLTMFRFGIAIIVAMAGLIATLIAFVVTGSATG